MYKIEIREVKGEDIKESGIIGKTLMLLLMIMMFPILMPIKFTYRFFFLLLLNINMTSLNIIQYVKCVLFNKDINKDNFYKMRIDMNK